MREVAGCTPPFRTFIFAFKAQPQAFPNLPSAGPGGSSRMRATG
jgi:hypothetical protein